MFSKTILSTTVLMVAQTNAVYIAGKCPHITKNFEASHPGEKLDLKRIQGLWGSVWEPVNRNVHSDCVTIKLQPFEGKDTRLQMLEGVSWKEHDLAVFDDHTILQFENEKDSSIAAITTSDDIDGTHTDKEHL